jgi:hypothetical protein
MIHPSALTLLRHWVEVVLAGMVALLGLWAAAQGGYVLLPIGAVITLLAAGYGLAAYQRMRFAQDPTAAGFIEVTEGQIAYFAEDGGGFISLPELIELRLVTVRQSRLWRLKQRDGQALLIPVDAAQNAALFDAFASLPQMNSAALLAALSTPPSTDNATLTLWRRAAPKLAAISSPP